MASRVAAPRVVGVTLDHVQRADDHRQEVVEVVGDASGQLADGLQLLRLQQGGLGRVAFGEGRLNPLFQKFVEAGQLGFGLLGVGGVEGHADEAGEGPGGIVARLRERLQPAPLAIGAAVARLQAERFAGSLAGDLLLEDARQVFGKDPGPPVQGEGFLIGEAREGDIGVVDELPHAAGLRHPHRGRGAVGQGAEAGLALAHLGLGAPTVGDVEVQADHPDRAAGLVAQDLAAAVDPALALAGVGQAILDLVVGQVVQRAEDDGFRHRAVVGMHEARQVGQDDLSVLRDAQVPARGGRKIEGAGRQIVVPGPHAGGGLGHAQPRLDIGALGAGRRQAPHGAAQPFGRRRDHQAADQVDDDGRQLVAVQRLAIASAPQPPAEDHAGHGGNHPPAPASVHRHQQDGRKKRLSRPDPAAQPQKAHPHQDGHGHANDRRDRTTPRRRRNRRDEPGANQRVNRSLLVNGADRVVFLLHPRSRQRCLAKRMDTLT